MLYLPYVSVITFLIPPVNIRSAGFDFPSLSLSFRNGVSTQVYNNQPPIRLNKITNSNIRMLDFAIVESDSID